MCSGDVRSMFDLMFDGCWICVRYKRIARSIDVRHSCDMCSRCLIVVQYMFARRSMYVRSNVESCSMYVRLMFDLMFDRCSIYIR